MGVEFGAIDASPYGAPFIPVGECKFIAKLFNDSRVKIQIY